MTTPSQPKLTYASTTKTEFEFAISFHDPNWYSKTKRSILMRSMPKISETTPLVAPNKGFERNVSAYTKSVSVAVNTGTAIVRQKK